MFKAGSKNGWRTWEPIAGPLDDARRNGLPVSATGRTALIPIMGPMFRRVSALMRMFGFTGGTEDMQAAIGAAAADDDIDEIILRIDSPGGSVSGLAELADAVAAASQVKPVIAQVEGSAFSAAYFVASQATSIFAGRGDMVGSIGVILMLYDDSKFFADLGVEPVPIITGPMKAAGAPGTEITDEQRAAFQAMIDSHFEQFVDAVERGRNLSRDQLAKTPQNADLMSPLDAGLFPADAALELGLIDGVQTLAETLASIASNASDRRDGRGRTSLARAKLALAGRP